MTKSENIFFSFGNILLEEMIKNLFTYLTFYPLSLRFVVLCFEQMKR
jgi:hypothetical protein